MQTSHPKWRLQLTQRTPLSTYHATCTSLTKGKHAHHLGSGDTPITAMQNALQDSEVHFATEADEIELCRAALRCQSVVIERRQRCIHVLPPQ